MKPKRKLFGGSKRRCHFVGCVHLLPLCGSHRWSGSMKAVLDLGLRDAERYLSGGADGLLVENTHDTPYSRQRVDDGTVAGMAVAAAELRRRFGVPIGIQILAGADVAAIDVAASCDLNFIRSEGFSYAHVADEGIIEGDAANILRRRAYVRADHVEVWTDVKKKHSSHAITADMSIHEEAKGAVYCGADGIIVTGSHTGEPPETDDVRGACGLGVRVVVGSGVDMTNIAELGSVADVLLVGSSCKKRGDWRQPVDVNRVRRLTQRLRDA
jgi:uncharacterized protein